MSDLPVACTLSPSALAARRQNLWPVLWQHSAERRDLPDGFSFRLATGAGVLSDIARLIDAERQCCRFLTFAMTAAPDEGSITLDVTGPPGTREFLEAMFES